MTSPITFLRETIDEIMKVVWPSQKQVIRLTLLVITISLIVGIYIGGLDFLFVKIMERMIK